MRSQMNILFESGEYQLGCYKVQYVTWTDGEWCGTGYWLKAIVTNHRLLVFPEKNAQEVETIPPEHITRAWNVCLRGRDGLMVELSDKRRLYMLVDWSQGSKFVRDIREMLTPRVTPRITPRLPNH
jgi:hypothetical protein